MQVRLTDGEGELTYNGIRDPGKLREFILTDVMAYFVHRRVSNLFHSKSADDSKRDRYREMSVAIARALALDFHGDNAGTPADQISKRVANVVDAVDGLEQRHKSPSTTVTGEQMEAIAGIAGRGPRQISVRLMPPLNSECGMFAPGESGTHVGMGDVCRHIIDSILVPSRDEMRLQSVLRQQYQVGATVLGDVKGLDETLMLECVRMYLAVRCVLRSPFQSVGDVYEPALDWESFAELLPPMPRRVELSSPVILSVGGDGAVAAALAGAGGPMAGAEVLRCSDDRTDVGVQLYKARLARDYMPCTLVVVCNGCPAERVLADVRSELSTMRWRPVSVVCVSDDRPSDGGVDTVWIGSRDRSPGDILDDVRVLADTGFLRNDGRSAALFRGPYRDVLGMGFALPDDAGTCTDAVEAAGALARVSSMLSPPGTPYRDMVECVRAVVRRVSEGGRGSL